MLYKSVWLGLLLTLSAFTVSAPTVQRWAVCQNSSLAVNGTTNINKFTCDIAAYDQNDTLVLNKTRGSKKIQLSGVIGLRVQSFDCHNAMMTHDLRKTLKEKDFPKLYIHFLSLEEFPELTPSPTSVTGRVSIELAGVSKCFDVNYSVSVDANITIHLIGSRHVKFSDFNLIPPRKLGGMIKTNDDLKVTFSLNIKSI